MEDDAVIEKLPNLEYAQYKFLLKTPDSVGVDKAEVKEKLLSAIKQHQMLPFYLSVAEDLGWQKDESLVEPMKKANEEKLKELDDKILDAEKNFGESEVREANQAKADFFTRIGDKEKAVSQYRLTLEKTVGIGQKLDVVFTVIRIGLFFGDNDLTLRNIEKAKTMIDQGGDWDRRNRLKVYEAFYCLSIREFKKAAQLLLEGIATFTSAELLDYKQFIFYTLLMGAVSLDRVTIKTKLLDSPEVLAVVDELPELGSLVRSLYNCNYAAFFVALAAVTDMLKIDRFLAKHAAYFCKEMKVIAYSQLLESYKSVRLDTMASAFGVTVEFLDREISRFIASGRLHCKIDKVGGIIETNRTDAKNAQYAAVIKQGDLLLNRIQKLSRVISL